MDEEYRLSDYSLKFYLSIVDAKSIPIVLDPKIGAFKISTDSTIY